LSRNVRCYLWTTIKFTPGGYSRSEEKTFSNDQKEKQHPGTYEDEKEKFPRGTTMTQQHRKKPKKENEKNDFER
jgi:hypothetical protein